MAREPVGPCDISGCAVIVVMLTVVVLLFVLVFVPQHQLDKLRAKLASVLQFDQDVTVDVNVGASGQRQVVVPVAPCPQLSQPVIVVVQAGDSLASIARRFGTTVDAIVIANQLTSIEIFVGQQLVIPVTAATSQIVVPVCPSPTGACPLPTPTCPAPTPTCPPPTAQPTPTPTCPPPASPTPTCQPTASPTMCPTMAARMRAGDP